MTETIRWCLAVAVELPWKATPRLMAAAVAAMIGPAVRP